MVTSIFLLHTNVFYLFPRPTAHQFINIKYVVYKCFLGICKAQDYSFTAWTGFRENKEKGKKYDRMFNSIEAEIAIFSPGVKINVLGYQSIILEYDWFPNKVLLDNTGYQSSILPYDWFPDHEVLNNAGYQSTILQFDWFPDRTV